MQSMKSSDLWQRLFRSRAEDALPHQIAHQRIYIIPSKRGWAFLITLLLMLVASINYSLSLGYGLCFLLTGLFWATLLHTYRNLSGIRIDAIHASDVFVGDTQVFSITLANPANRARHGIRVSSRSGVESMVRLEPQSQSVVAELASIARHRGVCNLGRLTFNSDWPLGLWTCWSYLHVPCHALVFPEPEQQVPPLPSMRGNDEGLLSDMAQQGDVSGLRDYRAGDSIGSIAWKSAARGQGLQSRTFDNETVDAQTVIDLQLATVSGTEAKLSRLCAWVLLAEHKRTDYAVRLSEFSLEKGRGNDQQRQALTALALYPQPDRKAA